MIQKDERPATGANRGGPSNAVQLAGERPEATAKLAFTLGPDGDPITVTGREAETLRLLVHVGPRGFTSGDASPLGWARRTSDYVFKPRRRGIAVATVRERVGDARIGRYVLQSPVILLSEREGRRCG